MYCMEHDPADEAHLKIEATQGIRGENCQIRVVSFLVTFEFKLTSVLSSEP